MEMTTQRIENAIEMYKNNNNIPNELKEVIIEAFKNKDLDYTVHELEANKDNFLKPGNYKASELTWEMVSQGRGLFRCYAYNGIRTSIEKPFYIERTGGRNNGIWVYNEKHYNEVIGKLMTEYGEDCPIEWTGSEIKNLSEKFKAYVEPESEKIRRFYNM